MRREEYSKIEGLNFSKGKFLLISPARYKAEMEEEEDTEDDKLRYAVGSLSHALVLEGKNLLDLYAIKPPKMSFATKEGKAWKAEQTKPILDSESALKIPRMAEAIAAHPLARNILLACPEREVALQAQIGDVLCKGMLDCFGRDSNGIGTIPDYKTTTDARAFHFKRKVDFQLHYDLQTELYRELARNCDRGECESLWIVQETNPPYDIMVYQPSAEMRQSGQAKLQKMLETYSECQRTGVWHGYQKTPAIETL